MITETRYPLTLKRILIFIVMTMVAFLVLTWVIHAMLISSNMYENRDFMSLFAGGRAILYGLDPYDPDVWNLLRAQLGSTWMPDDRAPYPLWTLLFFVPFSYLSLDWAAAYWLAFSFFALGIGMILLMQIFKPNKPISAYKLFVLALLTFTFRATLVSAHNGQITFQIFLFLVLFLQFERHELPFLAGIMLASVALKPNAFIFFIPSLGLWLLYKQRWSIIAGAAVGGLTILIVSWLLLPGWLGDWMNVRGKSIVAPFTPTIWGLSYELADANWLLLGVGFVVITTAFLGWVIFSKKDLTIPQVTSLALIGSLIITPYAWIYEHLFLLIPAIILFLSIERQWRAISMWVTIIFILPWGTLWLAYQTNRDTLSGLTTLVLGLMYLYCVIFKKVKLQLRSF